MSETHTTFAVGDRVADRYELRREIARGGMSVVFEAEHAYLGRKVALKCLYGDASESIAAERRLLREAKVLAAARHPGIVEVLDAGLDRRRPYVALEMLEGRALDGLIAARGALDVKNAVCLVCALAEALDHAHRVGVVHRDVKPSNVILTWDTDGREIAKLIDFGVAALEQDGAEETKITRQGELLGTFEYMAPEQVLADATDARSDVYALGVMLYELLTGDVPNRGTYAERASAVLHKTVPEPVMHRAPHVPPALDAVVRRALAHDAAERWHSCRALREALVDAVGEPGPLSVLGPRPKDIDPARQRARRFARAPFVTPVRVLRDVGHIDGRTEDISEGGILLVAARSFEPSEPVRVRFCLPFSGRMVTLPAVARWAKQARMHAATGLEFVDPPAEVRADIAHYVTLLGS